MPRRIDALALLVAATLAACPASAAPVPFDHAHWHDVKCARYAKAWAAALSHQGTGGLSPGFLDAHAAFLASNCTRRADVCARSSEEIKLANTMVVLSMNFGAASTLAPFACR